MTQDQSLGRVQLVISRRFPSPRLVALKKQSLFYYLPKARRKREGFMPFLGSLARSERQTEWEFGLKFFTVITVTVSDQLSSALVASGNNEKIPLPFYHSLCHFSKI